VSIKLKGTRLSKDNAPQPCGETTTGRNLTRSTALTLSAVGIGISYSRLNFYKRWMAKPIAGGAYRYAPGNSRGGGSGRHVNKF
jgi:hypothetical protein